MTTAPVSPTKASSMADDIYADILGAVSAGPRIMLKSRPLSGYGYQRAVCEFTGMIRVELDNGEHLWVRPDEVVRA